MAYALIAWQPPAGADPAQVEADLMSALPGSGPVRFFDHVILYPSSSVGIGFSTVRQRMTQVVSQHPGLELLIIMPEPGDTVAGWIDAAKGTFPAARPIMNRSGADTYPLLLQAPSAGGGA